MGRGGAERERERDRQTDRQTDRHTHTHTHTQVDFSFHIFMHSLVEPCMCPDLGWNLQPWQIRTQLSYPARAVLRILRLEHLPHKAPVQFLCVTDEKTEIQRE